MTAARGPAAAVETLRAFIERYAPKYLRDEDGVAYEGAQHVEILAALDALVQQLQQAREHANARDDDSLRFMEAAATEFKARKDAEARTERLEDALRRYGTHTFECSSPDVGDCDCGLREALASGGET